MQQVSVDSAAAPGAFATTLPPVETAATATDAVAKQGSTLPYAAPSNPLQESGQSCEPLASSSTVVEGRGAPLPALMAVKPPAEAAGIDAAAIRVPLGARCVDETVEEEEKAAAAVAVEGKGAADGSASTLMPALPTSSIHADTVEGFGEAVQEESPVLSTPTPAAAAVAAAARAGEAAGTAAAGPAAVDAALAVAAANAGTDVAAIVAPSDGDTADNPGTGQIQEAAAATVKADKAAAAAAAAAASGVPGDAAAAAADNAAAPAPAAAGPSGVHAGPAAATADNAAAPTETSRSPPPPAAAAASGVAPHGNAAPAADSVARAPKGTAGPAAAAAAAATTGPSGVPDDAAAVTASTAEAPAAAAAAGPSGVAPYGAAAASPTDPGAAAAAAAGSSGVATYGAAAASLADPACQPGTQEFAAAKAANEALLQKYNARERALHSKGAFKPDMQACSQLKEQMGSKIRSGVFGHVPGVAVGQQFLGRGQLAILGLHSQMMKGIDCKGGSAAFAICMAGGYKDDDDSGETFTYTGAGGQKAKRQVTDQSYDLADNAALVQNFESGTPVRVFRGKKQEGGKKGYPIYTYEGLYIITGHRLEPSADGPLVIRFTMQGVPGHFVVSGKVEYKALQLSAGLTKVKLAGAEGRQGPPNKRRKLSSNSSSKGYQWNFKTPTADQVAAQIQQRAKSGTAGRLVTADLSEGAEQVPVAVWNSIDSEDEIHVCRGLDQLDPPADGKSDFQYISSYRFTGADNAEEVAQMAAEAFERDCPVSCGVQYHGGECMYNVDGCLMSTQPQGVMECGPKCQEARSKRMKKGVSKTKRAELAEACKRNRVVTEGIKYPLEVFKTQDRGWALRSSVDISVGGVICAYLGEVITDTTAEQLRGADMYLYELHEFHSREEEMAKLQQPDQEVNPNYPPIPAELREHNLVVDAGRRGNVARFINHSCDPNCVTTVVFAEGALSQLLYYTIIVAAQDIPAYTELTYHYGDMYIEVDDSSEETDGSATKAAAAAADKSPATTEASCSIAQPAAAAAAGSAADTGAGTAAAAAAGSGGDEAGVAWGGSPDAAVSTQRRTRCRCGAANCKGWLKI